MLELSHEEANQDFETKRGTVHPLEQIWPPAEGTRGLKNLSTLLSQPLNTAVGTEVELLHCCLTQGSLNTLKSCTALSGHFPLQP
ncbi:hypothetical protein DV515_00016826 [Chloebia gouldiae]|uniref:Uncharacterized protein n=1 Tax=Chloebia gouldiae TaxID=44316 RepID=A0A3L8RA60_CHLGU|nr:hypothetical protein DV515_00016824 [Chloebia gouldiae]RLV76589.1 hypothetical protein DV515_00016826 [Chloebia gouldiae]